MLVCLLILVKILSCLFCEAYRTSQRWGGNTGSRAPLTPTAHHYQSSNQARYYSCCFVDLPPSLSEPAQPMDALDLSCHSKNLFRSPCMMCWSTPSHHSSLHFYHGRIPVEKAPQLLMTKERKKIMIGLTLIRKTM